MSVLQNMIVAFIAIVTGGIVMSLSTYAESIWYFPETSYSPRYRANNNDTRTASVIGKIHYDCFVSDGVHRHSPV